MPVPSRIILGAGPGRTARAGIVGRAGPGFTVMTYLILSCLASLVSIPRAGDDPSEVEFYESKIRPVLEKECYACHSAKAKELKAGLRLDTRRGLIDGGDSGPAVLPGKPDDSLLIRVIEHASEIAMMPPDKRLPDEVIADFRKWVASGIPGLPKDAPDPCGAATSGCSTFSPARLAIPGVAGPGRHRLEVRIIRTASRVRHRSGPRGARPTRGRLTVDRAS